MDWLKIIGIVQQYVKKMTKEEFLKICEVIYDLMTKDIGG